MKECHDSNFYLSDYSAVKNIFLLWYMVVHHHQHKR